MKNKDKRPTLQKVDGSIIMTRVMIAAGIGCGAVLWAAAGFMLYTNNV